MKLIIGTICSLLVIVNSCVKPCHEPDYHFSVIDSFFPEKDSVTVGDTVWLMCIIPKMEKDLNTQMIINFSNAAFLGVNLVLSDISKFNVQRDAADSFSYVNGQGRIYSDQYGGKQLSFAEVDTAYQLKIGLIALKAGLYILTLPDMPGVYRKGSQHCGIGNFQILNTNNNKHLYLFENLWGPLASYDSIHSYCVKVK